VEIIGKGEVGKGKGKMGGKVEARAGGAKVENQEEIVEMVEVWPVPIVIKVGQWLLDICANMTMLIQILDHWKYMFQNI
jgi:hypothetical protein